jgi:hypothetical protein
VEQVIDEKKLIEILSKNSIFEKITNAEGKNIFEIIEEQPQAYKWIPCEERLPSEEQNLYWTTHEDGSVILHGYTERHGFILNWEVDDLDKRKRQGNVVAWMLIEKPQPYKKEGEE